MLFAILVSFSTAAEKRRNICGYQHHNYHSHNIQTALHFFGHFSKHDLPAFLKLEA